MVKKETNINFIDDSFPFDFSKDIEWNINKLRTKLLRDGFTEEEADKLIYEKNSRYIKQGMTEQELIEGLIKIGYTQDEINELLNVYKILKKDNPDFSFEECYTRAIKVFEETKKWPKDGIFVD